MVTWGVPSSSFSFSALMSVATTFAPAAAKACTEARPMPCAAAVMRTILPFRSAIGKSPKFF
jgi:hypothetical protein